MDVTIAHILGRSPQFPVRCVIIAVLASLASPARATAGSGRTAVDFDVSPLVACRDVTTDEFLQLHPDDRLVEARVSVSALVRSGQLGGETEFLYRLASANGLTQIVDYRPRTKTATSVVGNIAMEKKNEENASLNVTVSGIPDSFIAGTASGGGGVKSGSSERFEILPPRDLVVASGTILRGSGVFFKLRPTTQTSLEGNRKLTVILQVSRSWRGGYAVIRCDARCRQDGSVPLTTDIDRCGSGRFTVALFLAGDLEAKATSLRFIAAERTLKATTVANHDAIEHRALPTLFHRVGAELAISRRKIPHNWLDDLMRDPNAEMSERLSRQLPPPVRSAAEEFVNARQLMRSLDAVSTSQAAVILAEPTDAAS